MAKLDAEDYEGIAKALSTQGRFGGNSAPPPPSSGSSGGSGIIDNAISGIGKLGSGSYNTAAALQDTAGIISKVSPTLGSALGGIAKGATDTNEMIRSTGKAGVNFGNDIGQARESITGARMDLGQFNNMVRKNSTDFAGLGQGVDQGTKNQLKLNQAVIEQADIQGSLAEKLMQSGVTADDFSTATRLVTLNSRAGMLQDKERAARATQSAIELADEMDKLAKITGKSKEQQANDLEKQMRKADVQATLLQMDDQQQQNYKKAQLTFGTLGEGVQDLASEIVTGGVRTKEGAAAMSALGPAGKEFEQALKQQMAARTPAEKAAAEAQMNLAKQHISEYQASKEYRDKLAYDRSASGDAARKMFTENKEMQGKLQTAGLIEKETGKPATSEQVIATQQRAADRQTKGQDVDTGKDLKGAGTGRAINQADFELGSVSAGLNTGFRKINDAIAPTPEALEKMTQKAREFGLGTQAGVAGKIDQGATAAQNFVGVRPQNTQSGTFNPETGEVKKVSREFGSPGVDQFLKGGSFGGMFEQFGKGTPAVLHGEEMVATKNQMTQMLGNMSKGMPGIGGSFNASDMMKGMEGAQSLTKADQAGMREALSKMGDKERLSMMQTGDLNSPMMQELKKMMGEGAFQGPMPSLSGKNAMPGIPKIPEIPKITPPSITPPPPPAPTAAPKQEDAGNIQKKAAPATADVTMKDLKDQLVHLNRSIEKLVSHSADTADAAHKQVKATKSMSGNRL
jgi:hypothetical protein